MPPPAAPQGSWASSPFGEDCESDRLGIDLVNFVDFAAANYADALQNRMEDDLPPIQNPVSYASCVVWTSTSEYLKERSLMEQELELEEQRMKKFVQEYYCGCY